MPSVAPLGDHVGGAELPAQVGAVLVVSHQHDPLGAEPPGGQHRAQPDRAVADHGHRRARADPGLHRGVVPGGEHVGQGQQRRQQRLVLPDGQLDQRARGLRHPHRLALPAVQPSPPHWPPWRQEVCRPSRQKSHVPSDHTNGATTRSPAWKPEHIGAGVLHDAEELVSHPAAVLRRRHRPVRPQVAAADARAQHPHDRVGWFPQDRVGHVLHPHVTGAVHQGGTHKKILPVMVVSSPGASAATIGAAEMIRIPVVASKRRPRGPPGRCPAPPVSAQPPSMKPRDSAREGEPAVPGTDRTPRPRTRTVT